MNKGFNYEVIAPGTVVFGRFTVLRMLTHSENGAIVLALANWGVAKGKAVALKMLSQDAPEQSIFQLKREITALQRCYHSNVIRFYDWFEDKDYIGYSMEYAACGTLEDLMEQTGVFSIPDALLILRQLALGIYEIHSKGYIHRDLKPQNIFMITPNQLCIGDLSISLPHNCGSGATIEELTGTVDYLSPEYISSGICDARSDIYAWGMIGYILTTKIVPFKEQSIVDTLHKKASNNATSIQSFRSDIPNPFAFLIMTAIERDPEDRFQSSFELIRAIDKCISKLATIIEPQTKIRLVA